MKVRKQQIPEIVHILNIPLTADIDKHDDDDDDALNNILMTVILLCSYSHSTQTQAQC